MPRPRRSCLPMLLTALLLSLAITGCGAGSRLPCSMLRRCPAPFVSSAARSPSVPTTPAADGRASGKPIVLTGELNAERGLTATVVTRLQWHSAAASNPTGHNGAAQLQLPISGTVSIINSADDINAAAVSVDFEVRARYPRTSLACKELVPPAATRGSYCWPVIATASPRAAGNAVAPLSKGQTLDVPIAAASADTAPGVEADDMAKMLSHPDVIIVSTAEVQAHPPFRFRNGCASTVSAPVAPGADKEQVTVEHVLVGESQHVSCDRIAW